MSVKSSSIKARGIKDPTKEIERKLENKEYQHMNQLIFDLILLVRFCKSLQEKTGESSPEMAHWSDCSVHNAPAMDPGPCDCGGCHIPTWETKQKELQSLQADNARLRERLQALCFMARTSGGTTGKDAQLVEQCELAEQALSSTTDYRAKIRAEAFEEAADIADKEVKRILHRRGTNYVHMEQGADFVREILSLRAKAEEKR